MTNGCVSGFLHFFTPCSTSGTCRPHRILRYSSAMNFWTRYQTNYKTMAVVRSIKKTCPYSSAMTGWVRSPSRLHQQCLQGLITTQKPWQMLVLARAPVPIIIESKRLYTVTWLPLCIGHARFTSSIFPASLRQYTRVVASAYLNTRFPSTWHSIRIQFNFIPVRSSAANRLT